MAVSSPFLPATVPSGGGGVGFVSVDKADMKKRVDAAVARAKARTTPEFQTDVLRTGLGIGVGKIALPRIESWTRPEPGQEPGMLSKPGRPALALAALSLAGAWAAQGRKGWEAVPDALLASASFGFGAHHAQTQEGIIKVTLPATVTPAPSGKNVLGADDVGSVADRVQRRQDRRAALVQGLAEEVAGVADPYALVDDSIGAVEDDAAVGASPFPLAAALGTWLQSIQAQQARAESGKSASQVVAGALGYGEMPHEAAVGVVSAESRKDRQRRRQEARQRKQASKRLVQSGKLQEELSAGKARDEAVLQLLREQGQAIAALNARLDVMQQAGGSGGSTQEPELIIDAE